MKVTDYLFEYTNDWHDVDIYTVSTAMKKYAEEFARKCLEKASEEVEVDFNILGVDNILAAYHNNLSKDLMNNDLEVFVLKHSITDIELPKHE